MAEPPRLPAHGAATDERDELQTCLWWGRGWRGEGSPGRTALAGLTQPRHGEDAHAEQSAPVPADTPLMGTFQVLGSLSHAPSPVPAGHLGETQFSSLLAGWSNVERQLKGSDWHLWLIELFCTIAAGKRLISIHI